MARRRAGCVRPAASSRSSQAPALLVRPVVGLVGGVPAPAVEGVVERHAGLELREVVGIHARQAERGREQARRLRREVEAARCRRRARSSRGAASGSVARPNSSTITSKVQSSPRWLQNTSLDVERRRAEAVGDAAHLGRRHEQEDGARIDEAADQPGAGDAVDLRPRARHPDRAALRVARRQLGRPAPAAGRAAPRPRGRLPAPRPATPACRSQAATPWLSLQALLADDDGGPARRIRPPSRRPWSRAAPPPRPGIRRGSAAKSSSVRTSIRAGQFGRADQAGELVGRRWC